MFLIHGQPSRTPVRMYVYPEATRQGQTSKLIDLPFALPHSVRPAKTASAMRKRMRGDANGCPVLPPPVRRRHPPRPDRRQSESYDQTELTLKIFLVLFGNVVKLTRNMKRLFTLIVLLGFLGVVAGCNQNGSTTTETPSTNAPAAPSTNK